MQKAERIGLGVAVAGHVVLFGLLSVGFLATPNPVKLESTPMDVSFSEEVAAEQTSPNADEAPAIAEAPETGTVADAAPPEAASEPEPASEPAPEPPAPEPKPQPAPRPEPKPAPAPKPVPKPAPQPEPKPAPAKSATPVKKPAKPAPAKPAVPANRPSRPTPTKPSTPHPAPSRPTPVKPGRPPSRLGNDFLKGIADTPTPGKAQAPRAAAVGAQSIAGLASAIQRQVQPCANRIPNPGPGANQIRSSIRLQMRPDGTLAAKPQLRGQKGITGENERYAQRVSELAIAALIQCAPYELPADLYEGGWKDIIINYKLPG